jgi:hypothetical protein
MDIIKILLTKNCYKQYLHNSIHKLPRNYQPAIKGGGGGQSIPGRGWHQGDYKLSHNPFLLVTKHSASNKTVSDHTY